MEFDFQKFAQSWKAPVVARTKVDVFSGGLLHPRTMANIDSDPEQEGPERVRMGGKIVYPVVPLIAWMEKRYGQEVTG